MQARAATDVGGTFTDLVYFFTDPRTGAQEVVTAKADTTPPEFELGVLDVLRKSGFSLTEIAHLAHGTTVVINALTERKGVAPASAPPSIRATARPAKRSSLPPTRRCTRRSAHDCAEGDRDRRSGPSAGGGEVKDERAAIVGVDLAADELARLQPVDDARERRRSRSGRSSPAGRGRGPHPG